MSSSNYFIGGVPPISEEPAATSLDDALRLLRMRRLQQSESWHEEALQEAAEPDETDAQTLEEEDQHDTENRSQAASEVSEPEAEEPEEEAYDFGAALEEMGQEVRRMGRELFKTNRAAERNEEQFNEAVTEIRQLSAAVTQASAQSLNALNETKFEAKAGLCRDLLRMSDTLAASLAAANELIAQVSHQAARPAQGLAFRFATTRALHETLGASVASLQQWRDGQKLLAERLQAALQTAGVRAIDSVGRTFDPALQRAVSVTIRHDLTPGTIVGEELTGYLLDGRILRFAEVIVSRHE